MLNENAASDMAASETVTEVDDAFEVADRVMLFLREQSVAPCPRTFELMFAYFLGKDPTLKEAVDALLEDPDFDPPQELVHLHDTIFGPPMQVIDLTGGVLKDVGDELTSIRASTSRLQEASQTFARELETSLEEIDSTDISEKGRNGIRHILAETGKMNAVTENVTVELDSSISKLDEAQQSLDDATASLYGDELTGLFNKRCYFKDLEAMAGEVEGSDRTLCLAVIDLDRFARINESFGIDIGDRVIVFFGKFLESSLDARAVAYRLGGQEFAVIFQDMTTDEAIGELDQTFRRFAAKEIYLKGTDKVIGKITASAGLTAIVPGERPSKMMIRAEQLLGDAKRAGGAQVAVGPDHIAQ